MTELFPGNSLSVCSKSQNILNWKDPQGSSSAHDPAQAHPKSHIMNWRALSKPGQELLLLLIIIITNNFKIILQSCTSKETKEIKNNPSYCWNSLQLQWATAESSWELGKDISKDGLEKCKCAKRGKGGESAHDKVNCANYFRLCSLKHIFGFFPLTSAINPSSTAEV